MTLAPGSRLGPYEIVAPLGAGGMGEVYRAKDPRLGREVAIKVLPAELASDPDRLRRFEQEAKAVSALNHPHIVTLYEVGQSEHGPYLVLEKIEGQSLRELLCSGALPVKRVLTLGAQVAEGLAKAHAAGIVHRDLKPENIMVTGDGFAKILDFGLAKLVYPELEGSAIGDATTLAERTGTGMIVGTLGYLSPEQAVGKPADFRSDQFALGALLYEMSTGERPFRRETVPESLAAVIREPAEPLRAKNAALPAQLGWIVERCLAKDANDRYASTRDLARDLTDLRDHLSEIGRGAAAAPAEGKPSLVRGKLLWTVAGLVAGAALAAVALELLAGPTVGTAPPSYRPLTSRLGVVTGAKFAPDGKTIYYSAAFGAEPSRVYVTRLESAESQRLDLPPAILRSVSSKGELALTLTEQREPTNAQGTLARVSPLGGTPRALIDDAVDADWAPDGEQLAVVRGRTERRLEFPIGEERDRGVAFPRLSPAGDRIAFARPTTPTTIEIHDLDGRIVLRHEIPFIYGMAWAKGSGELWFTGSESTGGTDRALYALSLDGKRRLLARAPGALNLYDVAPDGRSALVATGSGRIGIVARGPGASFERSLDLFGRTQLAGLSADGRFVLVREEREIGRGAYLLSSDGAQSVRLGSDDALGLSPDGAWALLLRAGGPSRLVLVPTGAGAEREVPLDAALTPVAARWSSDGNRLFVAMNRQGDRAGAFRIYLRDGERPWRAVTPEGTPFFAVSSDGAWVAARDTQGAFALHPVGGGAPRALPEAQGFLGPIHWSRDGRWLVLRQPNQLPAKLFRLELATGRVEPWREFAPADPAGAVFVMDQRFSDDESSYAYSVLRATNELFLVEGLN